MGICCLIKNYAETLAASLATYFEPKDKSEIKYNKKQKKREVRVRKLPRQIFNYYRKSNNLELINLAEYVAKHGLQMIPYDFRLNYRPESVRVFYDDPVHYPYVEINSARIYFPKEFKEAEIQNAVACALMEQDKDSPHKYQMPSIINANETAVLAGASDGIFCLSIIDKVKKVVLFEGDERWIAPLNLTLKPYADKVEIVNKYISSCDTEDSVRLDTFFSSKDEHVGYIQADIEGGEKDLLLGADRVLRSNNHMTLSICCYHTQNHQFELESILSRYGYKIHYSPGYMLMWMQGSLQQPYFRKGVLYT